MLDKDKYIGYCPMCDWKRTGAGHYKNNSWVSGYDIVRDKLWEHIEEEHIDTVMEVWMNNQSSNNVVKFKDKDLKCKCERILALCDCVNPQSLNVSPQAYIQH